MEVSRKLKHALLTRDFKTYTFHARFSPIRARDNYIKLPADLTNVDEVTKNENKALIVFSFLPDEEYVTFVLTLINSKSST